MINDIISMNGYGIYVWSAFAFTLISFAVLYTVIKIQLVKEKIKFDKKYLTLTSDTPDMHYASDVYLGKGPCISLFSFHGRGTLNGVIPHPSMVEIFEKAAKIKKINLQRSVASGILTDASYIQFANKGIATVDIGFPMRYSHSSREVCNLEDLINLKNLILTAINKIDKDFKLIR